VSPAGFGLRRERLQRLRKPYFLLEMRGRTVPPVDPDDQRVGMLAARVFVYQVVLEHTESQRERVVRDAALVHLLGFSVRQFAEQVANEMIVGVRGHVYSDETNPR
jgi:hypothetical protein